MQPPTLLTFASWSYRAVCENWLNGVHRTGGPAPLVCALDRRTYRWLKSRGVSTMPRFLSGRWPWHRSSETHRLGELWKLRLAVIRELLEEDEDVLHCDLDAVWRQNPLPYLEDPRWDVVASQGTTFPPEFFEKFGFVLCMGFIYFRARPNVREWLAQVDSRLAQSDDPDDQREVNHSLLSAQPISGGLVLGGLRIHTLPQSLVSRGPGGTLVAHPLAPKTAPGKIDALENASLWMAP